MEIYKTYAEGNLCPCLYRLQSASFVIHKKTIDAKKGDSDIPERAFSWLAMLAL